MKKLSGHWLVLMAVATALLAGTGCRKQEQPPPPNASVQEPAAVTEPAPVPEPAAASTAVAPSDTGEKKLPKLLDLGAKKCIPCKMMAPILEEMTKDYAGRMEVEFIDVWENAAAGQKYGIRSIPTQIFYGPDGQELFRHEGFISKEDILAKWSEFGYAFPARSGEQ